MTPKPAIKRKNFERAIVVLIILILFTGGGISGYFLVYQLSQPPIEPLPTLIPSPTPTPKYNSYLSRPANYVGTIIEMPKPNDLVVEREDKSRLMISLQPDIPVYQIVNNPGQIPEISIISISSLIIGQTLSVYTEGSNIMALFVSNGQ